MRRAMALTPILLLLASCHHQPAAAAKPPEGMKAWDDVLAVSTKIDGVIPIRMKRDHAVLLDLHPADLGREFGLALSIHRGTGTLDLIDGTALGGTQLVHLRREGDKVYLLLRNPAARAPAGSPLSVAVERDSGESVVGAFPVVSEGPGGEFLADATELLASDYAGIIPAYGQDLAAKADTRLSFDRARSYVERVRGFPANVEIDTTLTFTSAAPDPRRIPLAADPRAISVGVRWSFFALPAVPMKPRIADDRIGYFLEQVRDYSRANASNIDTDLEYLDRWRLEKRDEHAAISEPVQPIRFYLDRSIPVEYRGVVRDAVLEWNRAFEAAGFRNAIVVEDAPADLDYNDMRYSTIHWSTSFDPTYYAYGPEVADPRTGEILNADVVVIADAIPWQLNALRLHTRGCAASEIAREQTLLATLAAARPDSPESQAGPMLKYLVMHEVGHTLGLRHNFRGSASTPFNKLDDIAWVDAHGNIASVMDYPAINIAADRKHQGRFYTPTIGDYDTFAIAYGYTPLYEQPGVLAATPEAERAALAKLTAGTGDPLHAFADDEDNWLGAWAVDPATSGWDLGDDPIAFVRQRIALLDEVTPKLADTLVERDEPWGPVRDALPLLLAERGFHLTNLDKMIGGATVTHAHKGGAVPITPIPAERQRRALDLVIEGGFSERAWRIPPEILAVTPPRRSHAMGLYEQMLVPIDLPIHSLVLAQQKTVLDDLLSPVRLRRVVDNQSRVPAGTAVMTVSELMASLSVGLFGELDSPRPAIGSFRRNAQRLYVDELIGLLWSGENKMPVLDNLMKYGDQTSIPVPPPPADARAAARHELAGIADRASKRAAVAADSDTRAHLEELASRITHALNATFTTPARP